MYSNDWKFVHGGDLTNRSSAILDIPTQGGVYAWRRGVRADPLAESNRSKFQTWLEQELQKTTTAITEHRHGLIHFDAIRMSSQGLTEEKKRYLEDFFNHFPERAASRALTFYFSQATYITPPFYIGHAVNLRDRVTNHIRNKTGLWPYVEKYLSLSIEDCAFCYIEIPNEGFSSDEDYAKFLALVEYFLQSTSTPFATQRLG